MTANGFGMAFPGQGAKPEAVAEALREHRHHRLVARLSATFGAADPAGLDLTDTAVAQPTTCALGIAAAETAFGRGARWPVVLGHSLGELTAAACAGIVGTQSAFELAVIRGRLCREANRRRPGAMLAVVGGDPDDVEWLRRGAVAGGGEVLEIAGLNSRRQAVLSGDLAAVERATRLADQQGLRSERLPIGGGFHSPLMLDAVAEWRSCLDAVEFRDGTSPFVSSITARVHTDPAEVRELLVRALVLPVRWRDAVLAVRSLGVPGLVDAGPGETLLKLGRRDRILPFTEVRELRRVTPLTA